MLRGPLGRRFGVTAAILGVVVGLTGCGSSDDDAAGGTDDVTVALTAPSWSTETAVFLLADRLGYFEQEGLSVEFNLAKSGTEAVQQLIGGNADVAVATGEPIVIAAQQQTEVQYFMPNYGHFIYELRALDGSGIETVEDLVGKRIGLTNTNSTGATIVRTALRNAGLQESDVTLVPIGVGAQLVTAVQNGDVDALALFDTLYLTLESQGIETSVIPVPEIEGLFGGGLAALAEDLEDDPDLYARFGRAVAKGLAWARLHPEEAVREEWEALPELRPGTGQDEATVLATQVTYINNRLNFLIPDPESTDWTTMDEESMSRFISWAADSELITEEPSVDAVLTNSLADQIGDFEPTELEPTS
ncbi:ABC transporter substrate-binding protein [Modestobacter sp. VKM Ac-2978]|uniref:ABC transporter substrate-binding protein n=1 Tax=Modestobacter sp. VKM Ac-2978 TaxID=3004132 RepID=UPI0022AACFF0|nr:ABC transporter substrate-binding protein [Modestobacter sp. VKM Ac-2978]MCZ2847811.1 ABC transporter substrate-binding protein [Modestobacter sp. VKM Ac-2978]